KIKAMKKYSHNIKLLVGLLHVIVAEYIESKTEVKPEKGSLSVVYEFCISEFDATEDLLDTLVTYLWHIHGTNEPKGLKHPTHTVCRIQEAWGLLVLLYNIKNKHYMKQLTTGTIKQANKRIVEVPVN
ncbi:hypothetical protein ACJX0J_038046, partial [Zea mays]